LPIRIPPLGWSAVPSPNNHTSPIAFAAATGRAALADATLADAAAVSRPDARAPAETARADVRDAAAPVNGTVGGGAMSRPRARIGTELGEPAGKPADRERSDREAADREPALPDLADPASAGPAPAVGPATELVVDSAPGLAVSAEATACTDAIAAPTPTATAPTRPR
jgi:hypothetical protein